MQKTLITTALCLSLMACAGKDSEKVAAMQKKDKNLTCREVLLEQNEAEFYKSTAQKNKNPDVKSLVMPLGYISTYMNAEEAVGAANARVEYLVRIYEIMGCDQKIQMADRKNKLVSRQMAETMDSSEDGTPMPTPVMQPMVMQPQPMQYQMQQPPRQEAQGPAFY